MLQVNPWDLNGSGVQWIKSSQTLFVLRHQQQLKVAGVATVKTQVCDVTSGGTASQTLQLYGVIIFGAHSSAGDGTFREFLHAHKLYYTEKLLSSEENKSIWSSINVSACPLMSTQVHN